VSSPEPHLLHSAENTAGVRRRYPAVDRFTVLVVDPDPEMSAAIAAQLDPTVAEVVACIDGADGLYQAGRLAPALIVLSAVLPSLSTCAIVEAIRRHDDVPVVLGVGDGDTGFVGPALFAGASEVLARPYRESDVNRIVTRYLPQLNARRDQLARLTVGEIELDGPGMAVRVRGRAVPVTLREFQLLRLLMLNADRVVKHEEIRDEVWGAQGVTVRTISVHIYRLRGHLEDAADLVAVRGVGYRLSPRLAKET
jgi:DNA-binding response OmpR family regulator